MSVRNITKTFTHGGRIVLIAVTVWCSALMGFGADDIVFLAGDRSHGPGEHEFNAGCQLLAKALNEQSGLGVKARVIQGWPTDESILDGIKALVIYSDSTKVVGKGWAKVDGLAKQGVGLMFMHYAVHPSKVDGDKYYRPWIGGAFETGWSVNPHWVADLNALPDHPIARGVTSLVQAYDEFYYHMRFVPETATVLDLVTATPTRERIKRYINLWNEHGVAGLDRPQTLMWGIERPDGGRGVGFTGGHYHRNWAIDGFRRLVLNAIVWTAKIEVPMEGVKSFAISEDELNANLDVKKTIVRLTVPRPEEFSALPAAAVPSDREATFPTLPSQAVPDQAVPGKIGQGVGSVPQPNQVTGAEVMSTKSESVVETTVATKSAKTAEVKPVYSSPVLIATDNKHVVEIDVALINAKELYLVVSEEGKSTNDKALWLNPRLVMKDGTSRDLTAMRWKSTIAGLGKVRLGRASDGGPLVFNGKEYERGIGSQGATTVAYDLPEGVARFTALAVLDVNVGRDEKASDAAIRFLVYTQSLGQSPSLNGVTLVPPELFTAVDDLEVTLWATSPLLYNPTNIDFDAQGRLYVAEGVNYRRQRDRRREGDRIVVLEDTTGQGKADKTTVFLQESALAAPLGVAVIGDKIVVSQAPNLSVFTDVDHNQIFDPAVDQREVLLTGFNGAQHDHSLHSLTVGPDGQWYFNQGNMGAQFTDKSGKVFRMGSAYRGQDIAGSASDDGKIWIGGFTARMNPNGTNVTILGHNYRNSYEQTITSFGDIFQSDNDDPPACRVTEVIEGGNAGFASADGKRTWGADKRPGQDTPTAQWRQEDPGTMPAGDIYGGGAPAGVAFYENGSLPEKWRGLLLVCETGRNVVFGYLPKRSGAGFTLERFDFLTSNREKKWAGSDFLGGRATGEIKTMFRPSDICVGPDGAIYVADWFDPGVGGHGTRDDGYTGSIYRIAPKGFISRIPKSDPNTIAGQIELLKSPSPNVRNMGFVRLRAQGAVAVPAVSALLRDENPYIAARAAWLLSQMGDSGIAAIVPWLSSADADQRRVAYRALRRINYETLVMAAKMARDPSPAVRREVALSLRDVPAEQSIDLLVEIGKQYDGKDRTYLEAFGLGCSGKESEVYAALSKIMGGAAETWSDAFAGLAWRLHPTQAVADFKVRAQSTLLSKEQRKLMLTALAFVSSREAAKAMLELADDKEFTMRDLALWWLLNRKGNDWKSYDVDGDLKARNLYDPEKVKLVAVEMPPEAKGPALPPTAEIAKLTGDAMRGQARSVICLTCHRIGESGVDFGPDLTEFGKQQTAEIVIQAIAEPSVTISHGFEGSEVKTTDGVTITGLILSASDPVVIKCVGGLLQTVPKDRIVSITRMKRSLMLPPQVIGLDAQGIADIVAYLKGVK